MYEKIYRSQPSMYINSAKEETQGVFWVIDDRLYAFPFYEGANVGVAKSGDTYNHKKLWQEVKPNGCNKSYNYYPRGRVMFDNKNRPVIYMNPNIDNGFLSHIKSEFGLRENPIVKYDCSKHYKCHIDDGWVAD